MNPEATETAANLPAQGEAMTTVGPVVGGGELLSMGLSMFVVVAVIRIDGRLAGLLGVEELLGANAEESRGAGNGTARRQRGSRGNRRKGGRRHRRLTRSRNRRRSLRRRDGRS